MARVEQTEVKGGDQTPSAAESAGVLAARRHFLAGSIGISAFAATLSSRRAYAWSGGGCGPVTALCSPTHSHTVNAPTCVGNHCDNYCQNAQTTNWGGYECNNTTFANCGWTISPTGCSISPGTRLCDALNTCYQQVQQNSFYGVYGYQQGQNNCNVNQWNQWGQENSPCGCWVYQTSCDNSQSGFQGWLACCLLNCLHPTTSWYYNCPTFISACQRVYDSRCVANPEPVLCGLFSSLCTQNRKPEGCGGDNCLWNKWQ